MVEITFKKTEQSVIYDYYINTEKYKDSTFMLKRSGNQWFWKLVDIGTNEWSTCYENDDDIEFRPSYLNKFLREEKLKRILT